jgi:hypothetical protein
MDKKIDFTIFCLESYKQKYKMTGKEVLNIFKRYRVFDYLESYYDILHSIGQKYLVNDIDKYINSRKS